MSLTGRDGGTYKPAKAVYGRSAGSWLYAKVVWAFRGGEWRRAWTDCRKYDEPGGRDWSSPSTSVTYSGDCGNRTETTTTTRTKTGCANDVRSSTVSSPNCTNDCFDITTDSCDGCGSRTIYTSKAGKNCTSYTTGSCGSWSPATATFTSGGFTYVYQGPPGTFYIDDDFQATDPPGCSACSVDCLRFAFYYIENCSAGGRRGTSTPTNCGSCQTVFGDPC